MAYILLDKCVVRGLSAEELHQLGLMHTLLIPHVLMRETLAEIERYSDDGAGEKSLAIAAKKMLKANPHILPNTEKLVKNELLGIMPVYMQGTPPSLPLNMPVPRNVDGRGGSQGIFLGERSERKHLQSWSEGVIDGSLRDEAKKILNRDYNMEQMTKQISAIRNGLKELPKFKYFHDVANYLRNSYLSAEDPELHLKLMAEGILDEDEVSDLLDRCRGLNVPYYNKFPYAFFCYWIRSSLTVGMVQEVDLYKANGRQTKMTLSGLKNNKLHIDFQYLHYLPFCQVLASSDSALIGAAASFVQEGTMGTINTSELKHILKKHADAPGSESQLDQKSFDTNTDIEADEQSISSKASGRCENNSTPTFDKQELSDLTSLSVDFLKGILLTAGCPPNCDWKEFRRSFNSDNVKRVFDFQANFWPPSNKLIELDKEARKNNLLRCIYLGDLNELDVKQQITRWILHLDQIIIPDPFSFTWLTRDDLHPTNRPEIYELWTMKLLHCLLLIEPLVSEGYVVLVPNPLDFKPSKLEEFSRTNHAPSEIEDKTREHFLLETARARIAAGIPEDERQSALVTAYGRPEHANIYAKLAKDVHKNDPIWVGRTSIIDPMTYILRTGICFEEALIIAGFYQAVPMLSSHEALSNCFRSQSDKHGASEHLNSYLSQLEVLYQQEPVITKGLRQQGVADSIRKVLRDFVCAGSKPADAVIDSAFKDYKNDTNLFSNIMSERPGTSRSKLLISHKMELLHSSKRFATPQAKKLIEAYDSNLLDKLPEYAINVPITKVPDPSMKLFL